MGTAAVTPTDGLIGPCSKSCKLVSTDLVSTVTNALLVANVPAGPLKTFLEATYADQAAADLAWRALGGRIDLRQTAGTASTSGIVPLWVASASTPSFSLTQVGTTDAAYEATFAVLHSAIR